MTENVPFVATFLILTECSKPLILKIDFWRKYGAVVIIRDGVITFVTDKPVTHDPDQEHRVLCVVDDDVCMPPLSCSLVSVWCGVHCNEDAIAERITVPVLRQGIAIARGIVSLVDGRAEVFLTNFTNEHRYIGKGTALAYLEELDYTHDCLVMQGEATARSAPHTLPVNIGPSLTPTERCCLMELLNQFKDCFSSTSQIGQTPLTKHRIITEDTAKPTQ